MLKGYSLKREGIWEAKTVGGIRDKLESAAEKAKELSGSVAGTAAEMGGAVAGKVVATGGAVAGCAKEGARLATDVQFEVRRRRYAPVFPDEFRSPGYDLPNMVIIEDEDKRKGIDVCEGAIGWLTKSSNGMEVLHLYHAFAEGSGLLFHPLAQIGAAYVRDPSGLDRFLDLESLYREIQKEKMSELQHVAYCLGAKYCKLEMRETQVSDSKRGGRIKTSIKKTGVASESDDISADRSEQVSEDRRMLFERRFSGSDETRRPPLNWYKNDKEINALIEMRCSDDSKNEIQDYVVDIDCRSSAALAQTRASEIDSALKGLKVSIGVSLQEECYRESQQTMVLTVSF